MTRPSHRTIEIRPSAETHLYRSGGLAALGEREKSGGARGAPDRGSECVRSDCPAWRNDKGDLTQFRTSDGTSVKWWPSAGVLTIEVRRNRLGPLASVFCR